jgi:hypothetical protein
LISAVKPQTVEEVEKKKASYEDIKAALQGLAERVNKEKALEILAAVGAKKVSEIPADLIDKTMGLIEIALNPPKTEASSFLD